MRNSPIYLNSLIDDLNYKALKYGLEVRLVNESDATIILNLRTNLQLSKHIHSTDVNLDKQKQYIRDYQIKESKGVEYYFAFLIVGDNEPVGFYRVHSIDYKNKSFTLGSWIFKQGIIGAPIYADILSKEFGFEQLNLEVCYFDVRRDNKKVMKYHKLFTPEFLSEDAEMNNYFRLKKEDFEENKNKILSILI